jgi:D-glycero-D-manno-heptose 1,7-bisphosphate phosphatase
MGQIVSLDKRSQERLIVENFLFTVSSPRGAVPAIQDVVLLDRDGTIIQEKEYLRDPEQLSFEEKAVEALRSLQDARKFVAVVSNQAGLAKGVISFEEFALVNRRFLSTLQEQSTTVQAIIYCPFHGEGTVPEYTCRSPFRKPGTGMYHILEHTFGLRPSCLFVVGDKISDVEFGNRLGANTFFLTTGHGSGELPDLARTRLAYRTKTSLYDAVSEILSHPTTL